jgi:putative thioredoxin
MDPRTTPSIFTRGAVDLGALRDQAPPPGAPAPAAPNQANGGTGAAPVEAGPVSTPGGATIVDVTEATFQSEVLERSMSTPVVIDFWADWCGPCKQLSPVLEKLAMEGGGSWVLAKIDVDANPRLAQAFRVQSIPMVFAVVGGQPVDAFTGVIPEAQLRQWIDAVRRAGGGEVPAPEDPILVAADDALIAGDLDEAERGYKKVLSDRPADAAAEAGLAQVGLLRRVAGADHDAAMAAADAAPDDLSAQTLAADLDVVGGQAARAYERLIDLVRRSAGEDREKVREHLVELFSMAGPDDPAVAAARRALANALF